MAVIYRINMSDLSVVVEPVPDKYERLGGRGLTSAMVADEVPPTCHPLSAENKLVFAPGILTGSGAPCAGRLSAGAKSPLTGTIKEANSGGMGALALAALGVKALVIEGKPADDRLHRLIVDRQGVRIEAADDLAGLGNYETVERLFQQYGEKVACLSIGQAGEMCCAAASVAVTDVERRPTRHCGRGGLGAVMGSKRVKAIVIDPTGGQRAQPADRAGFTAAVKKFADALSGHPLTGQTLPTYGTNALANVINEAGAYPTRSFTGGQFEGTEAISGERQHDLIVARGGVIAHACHRGCTIKCSRTYVDESGQYVTKGPEYETVWAHGANCGIDDLDAIAQMDRMDDDLGLDTIETGVTIAVAMDAGIIPFGDAQGALGLLREVAQGTPLGRLVASGAEVLGKAYGVVRIPTVKGQSMPAYDPRAIKGIGVTYATTTQGADHTAGYAIAQNVLGVGGKLDALATEGQAELSRNLQVATAAIDASGMCLFVAFAVLDDPNALNGLCELIAAHTGVPFAAQQLTDLGKAVLVKERDFNARAGFTALDDRLPDYFKTEKLAPHNTTFDVPDDDLDKVLDFSR
ncbi:MAG: aldehyde ferredoxin oxidoreductase [Planctomycetes bacterium]|nr:aldehyde ferredoxin oxidoreductase [Planctomycetota bacterium]